MPYTTIREISSQDHHLSYEKEPYQHSQGAGTALSYLFYNY